MRLCNDVKYNRKVRNWCCGKRAGHSGVHKDARNGAEWRHPPVPYGMPKRSKPSDPGDDTKPKWWYEIITMDHETGRVVERRKVS